MAWVLQPEDSLFLWVGGLGIACSAASFVFWRLLSEYFELEGGNLDFVRLLGKSETRKSLGPITDNIEAIVVQTWLTRHAGLMSLALVDKGAKVMPLEHYRLPEQDKVEMPLSAYEDVVRRGKELAEAIGIPFQHGAEGEHLSVKKVDGKVVIAYTTESPVRPLLALIVVTLALLPLLYFAFSRYTEF